MRLHFEDKFIVGAQSAKVWAFVSDPKQFVKVIPDLVEFNYVSQREFSASFKVGLGMVKGTIKMNFQFEDMKASESMKVKGRGSGLQSVADLVIALRLEPSEGKTLLSWAADLVVGGLVASVGGRLLQSTTEKKVREIVEGIRRELG